MAIRQRYRMSKKDLLRQQIEHYAKTLDNFRTVIKDTNNHIATTLDNEYNCMGYAFGCYDWMDLESFRCLDNFDNEDYIDAELKEMTLDCVQEIIEYGFRQISQPHYVKAHERVIAFRCGYDDFHFARLNSDGIWTHKPGGKFIRKMTEDELYGDAWCEHRRYPYTSKVYFFAIKKDFNPFW